MDNYEHCLKQNAEEKESLTMKNQNLQEECTSLTSLLQEEKQKNVNATLQIKELHGQLTKESQKKVSRNILKILQVNATRHLNTMFKHFKFI